MINNPGLGRFYLLPKIHKRLNGVPGRPVISNCGYFTENISEFLYYHLQPLAKTVTSYIKDTNHFLKKLSELGEIPEDAILCTVDVVGLYPNIPHGEGLEALRGALEHREDKTVSTESLTELARIVLKNNCFEFNGEFYQQRQAETQKHCKPTNLVWRKVLAKIEEGLVVKNKILYYWHRFRK